MIYVTGGDDIRRFPTTPYSRYNDATTMLLPAGDVTLNVDLDLGQLSAAGTLAPTQVMQEAEVRAIV